MNVGLEMKYDLNSQNTSSEMVNIKSIVELILKSNEEADKSIQLLQTTKEIAQQQDALNIRANIMQYEIK
jgi:hypothetical protein